MNEGTEFGQALGNAIILFFVGYLSYGVFFGDESFFS